MHVLHLEQYSAAFQRAGLATLHQCHSLSADQLECMGITLPGHRRRILASLLKAHGVGEPGLIESRKPQSSGPLSTPREENSTCGEREGGDGETWSPSPSTRPKPVPRERQVSRRKEDCGDGAEHKPMPTPRRMPRASGKQSESVGGMEQPVPKKRTSLCATVSTPTASDTSLPPIPQRSTPNCPPVCFTSHLNHPPPSPASASPGLKRRSPVARERAGCQSLILADKASHKPGRSVQPGTLSVQPPGSDGARQTPALPPKVGVLTNCHHSSPQCISAHPPLACR